MLLNSSVESLGCITPSTAGPQTMPTTICPMTSGSPVFRHIAPDIMVSTRIAHNVATNTAIGTFLPERLGQTFDTNGHRASAHATPTDGKRFLTR